MRIQNHYLFVLQRSSGELFCWTRQMRFEIQPKMVDNLSAQDDSVLPDIFDAHAGRRGLI